MRSLLVALLLLAGVAFGADYLVTRAAEARVAEQVEQSLGGGQAQVDLRGWPVSLGILTGRVDEAAITATQVPLRETSGIVPSLDVLLSGVRIPATGDASQVAAEAGRFVARIDQAALATMVAGSGVPAEIAQVQIVDDHLQVVAGGLAVDLNLFARDGALVVQPDNALLSTLSGGERTVPVEGLPSGTALEGARVEGGLLILEGPVDLAALVAPAG